MDRLWIVLVSVGMGVSYVLVGLPAFQNRLIPFRSSRGKNVTTLIIRSLLVFAFLVYLSLEV